MICNTIIIITCVIIISEPTAALVVESKAFALDVQPPSPAAQGVQAHGPSAPGESAPNQTSQQTGTKVRNISINFDLSTFKGTVYPKIYL